MTSSVQKIVTALAIAGLTAGCAARSARLPGALTPGVPSQVQVRIGARVTPVPLETYVLGAALSEVVPIGERPAVAARVYEVQAILARTYVAAHLNRHRREGFDVCDTTHCQLYEPGRIQTSSYAAIARTAVTRTAGRIVTFNRRPAEVLFHADCGGHTVTPAQAWGGTNHPYLPAQADTVPGLAHRAWQFSATSADWATLLGRDPRTAVGDTISQFRVTRTAAGGRVTEVLITGAGERRVSGEVLRAVVVATRGARAVLSSQFTVTRTPDGFRLDGSGFGHGVGLCQVGALARARRGDSLDAILGFYFPGTR